MTAFRGSQLQQPPPLLSFVVRRHESVALIEAIVNETEKTHVPNKFLAAALTGLLGVLVGFIIGFLPIVIAFLFETEEVRGWALLLALICGGVGAIVGGLLCAITGAIVGPRSTVWAIATKGVAGGLIGVLLGFMTGVLAFGFMEGQWLIFSGYSFGCAICGGWLGIVTGTIAGAWSAARAGEDTRTPNLG